VYIEHLDGRYAGQVRDIETFAALGLVESGRAKRVSFDAPAPEAPIVSAATTADEPKPVKKKGK
jgi:hypothetical protein